ncbi:hypothetical protein OsI_15785 [Oryza sativa Indica Group]|uniref:Uncharacterized protein n=2 Tax=Oryza TaxID=4527 RepID=A2XT48_ORYSI|nr:hypothetical protein OsI_15785 [Oryza sativa Indica Group]
MADPTRKEVEVIRKRIDVVNRQLKPLGKTCVKKEKEYKEILEAYNEKNKEKALLVNRLIENNMIIEEVNKGLNPGTIVLLVVATLLILFFVGNYALYMYAQKTLPPRKKKPVSKKKLKREKLKQGVSAPGE